MMTAGIEAQSAVDRAAVICIRCAVDRYWNIGTLNVTDECATACIEAATALLTADRHTAESMAVSLRRCSRACESIGSDDATLGAGEYIECARQCRELAQELTGAGLAELR